MPIPLLDLKAQHESIKEELTAAVSDVLSTQKYIMGPQVRELEERIAGYCQSRHAVACASGSDALLLGLMALGVGPGDEVVTTPYSFFATAGSIARLGARPIFVDIHPGTFNIDPTGIEAVLSPRTKAIIPVHLFGQCSEMDAILDVARRRGIPILEDAAQAIGSDYDGSRAGSLGDIAAFSFYPSKNLGCAGDGGMLTTSDQALADRLRSLRTHGASKKYFHDRVGLNSRLDTLQAAILLVKLNHLEEWTQLRQKNAAAYREKFRAAGLVDSGEITLPEEMGRGRHVYNQFVIRVRRRDQLRDYLKSKGIGTEVYYPLPLHLQKCFQYLGYSEGDFKTSEGASVETLAIPIFPELGPAAVEDVVRAIAGFYENARWQ